MRSRPRPLSLLGGIGFASIANLLSRDLEFVSLDTPEPETSVKVQPSPTQTSNVIRTQTRESARRLRQLAKANAKITG